MNNQVYNQLEFITDRKLVLDLPAGRHGGNTDDLIDEPAVSVYRRRHGGYTADVVSYSDYYAFGMTIPRRHGSEASYRYGFNGMEADNEVKGEKNSYEFGARMYNPRVGRWLSRDRFEQAYTDISPYAAFKNSPLYYIDNNGNYVVPTDEFTKKTLSNIIIEQDGSNEVSELLINNFGLVNGNRPTPKEFKKALRAGSLSKQQKEYVKTWYSSITSNQATLVQAVDYNVETGEILSTSNPNVEDARKELQSHPKFVGGKDFGYTEKNELDLSGVYLDDITFDGPTDFENLGWKNKLNIYVGQGADNVGVYETGNDRPLKLGAEGTFFGQGAADIVTFSIGKTKQIGFIIDMSIFGGTGEVFIPSASGDRVKYIDSGNNSETKLKVTQAIFNKTHDRQTNL